MIVYDIFYNISVLTFCRGKGFHFLRHVERTRVLCYVLDGMGEGDGREPVTDLEVLVREIEEYANGALLDRSSVVACNKLDLFEGDEKLEVVGRVQEAAERLGLIVPGEPVFGISAEGGEGLGDVAMEIRRLTEAERKKPLKADRR